jgi:hypothetical protein
VPVDVMFAVGVRAFGGGMGHTLRDRCDIMSPNVRDVGVGVGAVSGGLCGRHHDGLLRLRASSSRILHQCGLITSLGDGRKARRKATHIR